MIMESMWWRTETVIPTSDESEIEGTKENYPTEWHTINELLGIECRQLSDDTYQLKSPVNIITLDKKGFDLYRDDTPQGKVIFDNWCERNNIKVEPLPKVDDGES